MSQIAVPGLGPALLGTADPIKFTDPLRLDVSKDLMDRPGGEGAAAKRASSTSIEPNMLYTIIVVILSAVLFVTIISLFDIVRVLIGNYSNPNPTKTSIASTGYFALFCVIISLAFVPILCVFIWVSQHRRIHPDTMKPKHHIYI